MRSGLCTSLLGLALLTGCGGGGSGDDAGDGPYVPPVPPPVVQGSDHVDLGFGAAVDGRVPVQVQVEGGTADVRITVAAHRHRGQAVYPAAALALNDAGVAATDIYVSHAGSYLVTVHVIDSAGALSSASELVEVPAGATELSGMVADTVKATPVMLTWVPPGVDEEAALELDAVQVTPADQTFAFAGLAMSARHYRIVCEPSVVVP